MRRLLQHWLLIHIDAELAVMRGRIKQQQEQLDALSFFAADTCDVINPLIARVDKLEHGNDAPKTVPRRLRVKHK